MLPIRRALPGFGSVSNAVVADSIGGVAIGALGVAGTYNDSLAMGGGDDFDSAPTRWTTTNLLGKYGHSQPQQPRRTTGGSDNALFIDPTYRGKRSQSPVALGYDRVAVASSVLTLTASPPEAGLLPYLPTNFTGGRGDGNNQPMLVTGGLKSFPSMMVSAQADYAIEALVRFPAGVINGWWPSFWTTTMRNWPNNGEFDVMEGKKNTTTGAIAGCKVNAIGPGADETFINPSFNAGQWYRIAGRKQGTTLKYYDDTTGTFALRASSAGANPASFSGAHNIDLDLSIATAWDSGTLNLAQFPATMEVAWFRVWVPQTSASKASPRTILSEVNTVPGGAWDLSLPSAASLFGGAAGVEHIIGVYDNVDSPGYGTVDTTTRLPGGMTLDTGTRVATGTVPSTEGGRVCIGMLYGFDDGSPGALAYLPVNVAPAMVSLPDIAVAEGAAFSGTIPYTAFHSGILGHTYTVSCDRAWFNYTNNGTSIDYWGTRPVGESAQVIVTATNSVGQASVGLFFICTSVTAAVTDAFTGTSGSLLTAHTASGGQAWVAQSGYSPSSGSVISNANKVRAAGTNGCYHIATYTATDGRLRADFYRAGFLSGDNSGFAMRMQAGANTMYFVRRLHSTNSIDLCKIVGAAATQVIYSFPTSMVDGDIRNAGIICYRDYVSLEVDGLIRYTGQDTSSPISSAGFIGVRQQVAQTNSAGHHIDNLSFVSAA